MDFHNHAAAEATHLLQQLLARQASASLEGLRAVRDAVDAAARALETQASPEPELTELVGRLTGAAEAHANRAREEGQSALERANGEIAAREAEIGGLRGVVERAESELAALREELRQARERADSSDRELGAGVEARASLEAALDRGGAELRHAQEAQAAAERQLAEARAAIERMLAETEQLRAGQDDAEALRAEVDRMVSLFDASARAVSEMAIAGTSGELLTELVKRLSLHYSRVALFRLKGDRLQGEEQVGFDGTEITRIVVPTAVESMLTRAVRSGSVQSLHGEDVPVRSGTPFGGTPRSAVALPIVLQGTTLAVVYADDSDMPESTPAVHESSVGFARLLVGQVVVLLVRHTHELKTFAELTHYATTLLQEAREMYLADAQAGKSLDLLRSRLKENIDCASQLYAYRAAMEGTAAAALLDDQIAREIEGTTPFARDLAAVITDMASNDIKVTAEAS